MLIVYKFNFKLTIIGILLILRRGKELHMTRTCPLSLHVKNGACGSYVVANQDVMTELNGYDRNLRALDMEGYGLYTASYVLGGDRTALMIKAIADLGDKDKGDQYHDQCSFTSALFLREFLKYRFAIQENQ